jgi:hypothetical protein
MVKHNRKRMKGGEIGDSLITPLRRIASISETGSRAFFKDPTNQRPKNVIKTYCCDTDSAECAPSYSGYCDDPKKERHRCYNWDTTKTANPRTFVNGEYLSEDCELIRDLGIASTLIHSANALIPKRQVAPAGGKKSKRRKSKKTSKTQKRKSRK